MHPSLKALQLRLQKSSPRWMRFLYRALRAGRQGQVSNLLPPDLIRECRFCASRIDLIERLPRNGVVAELGTDRGAFARMILERSDPRELHLVDLDVSHVDGSLSRDGRIRLHRGRSSNVMAVFPDGYFDWVYVDADHSYEGTIEDARAAAAKVRPGGFLVFNDFAHIDLNLGRYGVHRAVVDFAIERTWPFAFFAFSADALYDVALQRPSIGN